MSRLFGSSISSCSLYVYSLSIPSIKSRPNLLSITHSCHTQRFSSAAREVTAHSEVPRENISVEFKKGKSHTTTFAQTLQVFSVR